MEFNKILLIQSPVISHSLVEMGKSVSERLAALNLENQVATDETVKTLKATRAELTKEAKAFEDQRKAVKNAILSPYSEFEEVYKSEIIDKYKSADETLRGKINDFEMSLKVEKKSALEKYFAEVCAMEQIDWLTFDRLKIDVNLSTSLKKYKEQTFESVQKIVDDIALISTEKYASEILVEYKKTLNASQAIQIVRQRKQAELLEAERLNNERISKRAFQLRGLSFIYHDLTRTYNWAKDESVMITHSEVESLEEEDWIKRYAELEAGCKPQDSPAVLQAPAVSSAEQASQDQNLQEYEIIFSITANAEQIKKIGAFLRENNYNFKQLN